MPAIVIDGLSPDALSALETRAAARNRTVEEEAREVLEEAAKRPPERLPMYVPSPETSAPFDLPYLTPGIKVKAKPGGERLPSLAFLPAAEGGDDAV